MNRIDAKFNGLRDAGRKGFVGYLTAGDPDLETSEKNIRLAIENGLDVLELGVPFSDPTADGPTIQEAAQNSLKKGMTVKKVLGMVSNLRKDYESLPIVLFGYANPFFRYGYDKICADAAEAGVDGMLIVDMPFEEADEIRGSMKSNGLHFIQLVAPTTPRERAEVILKDAEGFVYYIMVKGVTGARADVASDVNEKVAVLSECTGLPVAVGFGVSSGDQAAEAAKAADAVVVGSALIKAAREGRIDALSAEIRAALDK
ncbi:tryptophan synthase subunit alpha [bacterium B17]|nr:tryptophan synthase subunit alpha [bacterium B17]